VTIDAMRGSGELEVLVVDDEPELLAILADALRPDGHAVTAVANAAGALDAAVGGRFDIVLLDVALGPGPDGVEICRRLRAAGDEVPVIMLTARDTEADAVRGLEAGADDYITKPFGLAELRSRIGAVLRRSARGASAGRSIGAGEVVVDPDLREARVGAVAVSLTFSEFEILHALLRERRLHSRQELLRAVWGDSAFRDPRAIDVHVHHLRGKLAAAGAPEVIVTVRGAGYRVQG
jgi:DNA-binding response OmpR family regulator